MRSSFKFASLLTVLLVVSLNSRSVNAFAALLGVGARFAAKAAVKAGGKAIAKKAASKVAKKAAVSMAKRGASSVAKNAAKKAGNRIKSQAVKQVKSKAKSMMKQQSQASSPEVEQEQQQPNEEQETSFSPVNNIPPPTQPYSPAEQVVQQEAPPAYNPNVAASPTGFPPLQAPVYQTPPVMPSPNMYSSPPSSGSAQSGPMPYATNPSSGNNNMMINGGGIPSFMTAPGYLPSQSMVGGGIPTSGTYPYLPTNMYGNTPVFQPSGTGPSQWSNAGPQQYLPQWSHSQFTGNAPIINGQCYCPCAIRREQVYDDETPCSRSTGGRGNPERRRQPAVRVINLGDADDLNNALIAAGIDLPSSTIQNISASTLIEN